AVLIADKPVRAGVARVEFQLELHVLCNGRQRATDLLHQYLARLQHVVDVRVVAIAAIGELLQARILEVAHAEAEHGEEGAMFTLFLHEPHELGGARYTNIEVSVRGKQHAIVATFHMRLAGKTIGQANALTACSRTASLELLKRAEYALLVRNRSGGKHYAGISRIHHDRNAIVGTKLVHEHRKRLLQQWQLVRRKHGTRNVNEKHQVVRRKVFQVQPGSLEPHAYQQVVSVPRSTGNLRRHGHRAVVVRLVIRVREIVHQLFYANGVNRRQRALLHDETPHVRVRCPIHVD